MTELRQRASDCEFGEISDLLIKDILICGINDLRLSKRLLREAELTLEKAIQAGQAAEETRRQTRALATNDTDIEEVNTIKRKNRQRD